MSRGCELRSAGKSPSSSGRSQPGSPAGTAAHGRVYTGRLPISQTESGDKIYCRYSERRALLLGEETGGEAAAGHKGMKGLLRRLFVGSVAAPCAFCYVAPLLQHQCLVSHVSAVTRGLIPSRGTDRIPVQCPFRSPGAEGAAALPGVPRGPRARCSPASTSPPTRLLPGAGSHPASGGSTPCVFSASGRQKAEGLVFLPCRSSTRPGSNPRCLRRSAAVPSPDLPNMAARPPPPPSARPPQGASSARGGGAVRPRGGPGPAARWWQREERGWVGLGGETRPGRAPRTLTGARITDGRGDGGADRESASTRWEDARLSVAAKTRPPSHLCRAEAPCGEWVSPPPITWDPRPAPPPPPSVLAGPGEAPPLRARCCGRAAGRQGRGPRARRELRRR